MKDYNQRSLDKLQTENKGKKCPECGGEIVNNDNELTCKKCGLVM